MSLTVKAYVLPCRTKRDDFEEIRRFTISKNDANIFAKLFEKVCEVFPILEKDKTNLHWKDNDGDLIHFSTNKELTEAMKSITDGVFKLYAQETPLFKDSTEVHVGVLCSNCKKPVQGSRYKCLACPDYDLCHSCELVGTHLEHTMIKIPTPSTPWLAQIMQYSYTYGPMSPMSLSPMVLKSRNGDRGASNIDQSSPIMVRPSFTSSIGQPYSQNDWSLFNDSPTFSGAGIGQANAMQRSYQSEEMQSRQNRTTDLGALENGSKSSLFDYNESPPDKTSGDWTLLNSSSKSKETNQVTSSTKTESSSAKIQAESTKMTEISSEKEASSIKKASAVSAESTATAVHETKKGASAAAATNGAVKETDNEAVGATTAALSEDGGAVPAGDAVTSTTTDSIEGTEETTTDESGEPKPKVDNNVYIPSLRRYAEALDNLMSMGFTNEGGWLTVLVEEKRGDIIRVLDFIENNIQKCKENEQAKSRN